MYIYEMNGRRPRIHKTARILQGAVVAGDVVIGPDVVISWNAVVYAEQATLEIGRGACIGDGALVHAKQESIRIGEYSLIGHGAQICDANVGDRAQVGINAVVIDRALVADGAMLAADSFLKGTDTSAGSLWAGRPAVEVGPRPMKDMEARAKERLTLFESLRAIDLEQATYQ